MFYPLKNPPQWLLDAMMNHEKARATKTCPDCIAAPGCEHSERCDVARCSTSKIQRIQCDCGPCPKDVWSGLWPGTQEAYDWKLVCFDTATSSICFDLNEVAIRQQDPMRRSLRIGFPG